MRAGSKSIPPLEEGSEYQYIKFLSGILGLALNISIAVFIALMRSPDWSDEGLYHYDAIAAYTSGVSQSYASRMCLGVILGLPAAILSLFGLDYSVFVTRISSLLFWIVSHIFFFSAVLKSIQRPRNNFLAFLLSPIIFLPICMACLSYQNLSIAFYIIAIGLLLNSYSKDGHSNKRSFPAAICFITLGFLPYIPAISISSLWLILAFFYYRKERSGQLLKGLLLASFVLIPIVVKELFFSGNQFPEVSHRNLSSLHFTMIENAFTYYRTCTFPLILGICFLCIHIFFALPFLAWGLLALCFVLFGETLTPFIYSWKPLEPAGRLFEMSVIALPFLLFEFLKKIDPSHRGFFFLSFTLLGSFGFVQTLLGSLTPEYYSAYLAPTILCSFLLILFSRTKLEVVLASIFSIILITDTLQFTLQYAYRAPAPTDTLKTSNLSRFTPIRMSSERENAIGKLQALYKQYDCKKDTFVSIDRLPMSYVIVADFPPWKTSWIQERRLVKDYLEHFNKYCIVFRGSPKKLQIDYLLKERGYSMKTTPLGEYDLHFARVERAIKQGA